MSYNAKYVTFDEIYSRVTSIIKNKQINPADILEWCFQCETEWIRHTSSAVPYLKVKLPVRDKMARIPPYRLRILDVYSNPEDETSLVNYYDNGGYLILDSTYNKEYVYVNFLGLAVEPETGIPYIKKGNEEACVRFIICNLYYEDYLNGKINANQWNEMKDERNLQVRAAQSEMSEQDRRELREILAISLNMLPQIKFNSLYHKGMGE